MTDTVMAEELKAIIERIEALDEQRIGFVEDIKAVKAQAKADGFDLTGIAAVLKMRKKSREERKVEEAIIDTYAAALGLD